MADKRPPIEVGVKEFRANIKHYLYMGRKIYLTVSGLKVATIIPNYMLKELNGEN